MFTRLMCAGLVGAMALATPVQPAKAWGGGGGFAFGALAGVTAGVLLTRPYYAPYPYAYAPYPYPYYAPAPVYAVPPQGAYAYPPGYAPTYAAPAYAPPYAQPGYAPQAYAPQAVQPAAPMVASRTPTCGAGMFFNTLTGTCDRR